MTQFHSVSPSHYSEIVFFLTLLLQQSSLKKFQCQFRTLQSYNYAFYGIAIWSHTYLLLPSRSQPTEVEYKYTEDGEKVRVAVRSGMMIPKPPGLKDRKDFKSRSGYAGMLCCPVDSRGSWTN